MSRFLVFIPLVLFMFYGCGSATKMSGNAKYKLKQVISVNDNILSFGKADIKGIIEKSTLSDLPKIGVFNNLIEECYRYLNVEDSLYFASELLASNSINTYFILNVKNQDELVEFLKGVGFSFEEKADVLISSSKSLSIAISDNLCILANNNLGLNTRTKTIDFIETSSFTFDKSNIINEILDDNADIVTGLNLKSTIVGLNGLTESTNEIDRLFENSFIKSKVELNKGQIKVSTVHYLSNEIQKYLFLKESNGEWIRKIANKDFAAALSLNIDMGKLSMFVKNINPIIYEQLYNLSLFDLATLKNSNEIQNIFDGRLGCFLHSMPSKDHKYGVFSVFVGLGEKGAELIELIKLIANKEGIIVSQMDKGVMLTLGNTSTQQPQEKNIELNRIDFLGRKGISMFINFGKLKYNFIATSTVEKALINALESVKFELSSNGSMLEINFKDKEKYALSTVLNSILESYNFREVNTDSGDLIF